MWETPVGIRIPDAVRANPRAVSRPARPHPTPRGRHGHRRLEASATRLDDDTLTVVVCGEFKRGMSSLLNALLEESPPLFPVDAGEAARYR